MANEWNKAVTKPYEMYKGKKTGSSSEERLYNANLSQSDSDIAPNMGRDAKPVEKDKPKAKPKAKPTVKKLKDTSGDYWSGTGLSGDMGSASGETGPDMGQVNKGGYDADSDGMKRGGKVKKMAGGGSASSRGDGCAQRGKTRGKFV